MATSQIQASCGGASNGKAWHESYKKGALMDHFAATLDKVNSSSLESKMKKLRQAIDSLKQAQEQLKNYISDTANITQALETAASMWLRARVTKFEVLALCAIRDSRRKQDHLQKYSVQFFEEAEQDWKPHVLPELRTKIEDIIGG